MCLFSIVNQITLKPLKRISFVRTKKARKGERGRFFVILSDKLGGIFMRANELIRDCDKRLEIRLLEP